MTIWKFSLDPSGLIKLPIDAKILCVQSQYNLPYIWAIVDEKKPTETRQFRIFGTGFNIPENIELEYIDTFQLNNGTLVFHVFEEKRK